MSITRKPLYPMYKTVVIDPPWPVTKTRIRYAEDDKLDYETMEVRHIRYFPINDFAAPRSYCFLWTTNGFLEEAFDILRFWKYRYHCTLVWDKGNGVCPFSPYRISTEFVLFGTRGDTWFKDFPQGAYETCFTYPPGGHSRKPDFWYQQVKDVTPEPRVDIFARIKRNGFDAWGSAFGDRYEY